MIVDLNVRTARALLLRVLPTVPTAAKWTKVGPCLDFVIMGLLCHFLLRHAAIHALSSFTAAREKNKSDRSSLDPSVDEEVNWRAVTGRRASATRKLQC